MDALVVGAGEMGRWVAGHLEGTVGFADTDPALAAAAAEDARAKGWSAEAVPLDGEGADLVCVAVPMPVAVEALERHAPKAERAVVDVTGAMAAPLDAMARAAPERERLSLHPLFAADAAPGNVAVSGPGGPVTDALRERLAAAGNDIVEVGPDEHDDAMRTVQGRAHAAVLAFALAAEDVPAGLETPVYEALAHLVDRVTGNTPRVYGDVQATFGGAEDVAAAAERLAAADAEEFEALYEDAGR